MERDAPALFDAPAVRTAPIAALWADVAARLPAGIRLGTSSWSFPGWSGVVYDCPWDAGHLAREGLTAYAGHPLLRTVGVDRAFYGPVPVETYRRWAAQVPVGFSFLVKAAAAVTRPVLDDGRHNPRFLDAAWATDHVIAPVMEGLREKAGAILFQLSPMRPEHSGPPDAFAERLGRFLEALPTGPVFGVEARDRRLLVPAWADALRANGVVHCINVHPGMPTVATQARVAAACDPRAVMLRWMLHPEWSYAKAKQAFAPFNRLHAPHDAVLGHVVELLRQAARPAWVIANNKAEGSAPLTLQRIAAALVER